MSCQRKLDSHGQTQRKEMRKAEESVGTLSSAWYRSRTARRGHWLISRNPACLSMSQHASACQQHYCNLHIVIQFQHIVSGLPYIGSRRSKAKHTRPLNLNQHNIYLLPTTASTGLLGHSKTIREQKRACSTQTALYFTLSAL